MKSGPKPKSRRDRFDAKWRPHPLTGCWLWAASQTGAGYGKLETDGITELAHRIAWEEYRGPIPPGLQLDHLCRVRHCVNPDHLEPVTCKENLLRGETVNARNAAKTHCKYGHAFTPDNIYVHAKRGTRHCKACQRAATGRHLAKVG